MYRIKPSYLIIGIVVIILLICCGKCAASDTSSNKPASVVKIPAPEPTASPVTTRVKVKPKTTVRKKVYYENCNAVRAAGKDPLRRGQPGYSTKLDRNSDGVACERS